MSDNRLFEDACMAVGAKTREYHPANNLASWAANGCSIELFLSPSRGWMLIIDGDCSEPVGPFESAMQAAMEIRRRLRLADNVRAIGDKLSGTIRGRK